jgi:transcriptional regulator with XRE-family HTH domain
MDNTQFARNLRVAMAMKNMRVKDLAEQANIDASMVSRYRMGERMPNLKTLLRIKNALGVGLDDLV